MQTETIAISALQPYARNPKAHPPAQVKKIAASIREFGFLVPLVIDDKNNVIAGHGRLLAALELRLETVPVVRADGLTEAQIRAFRIADNRVAESKWLWGALIDELEDLRTFDFDLKTIGFDQSELRMLIKDLQKDPEARIDEAELLQKEWKTAAGQRWRIGPHVVLCGDSATSAGALFLDRKFDLLVTDPPYNVAYAMKNELMNKLDSGSRVQREMVSDHLSEAEWEKLISGVFTGIRPFARPGACYYVMGAQKPTNNMAAVVNRDELILRHTIIWAKNRFVFGRSDYKYQHEPIYYGWAKGRHRFFGGSGESALWEFDTPLQSEYHPTMKPVELFARAIKNSSQEDEIVFDPFLGSGTTIIAAAQSGRVGYGIEIDPCYVAVTLQRLADMDLRPELER